VSARGEESCPARAARRGFLDLRRRQLAAVAGRQQDRSDVVASCGGRRQDALDVRSEERVGEDGQRQASYLAVEVDPLAVVPHVDVCGGSLGHPSPVRLDPLRRERRPERSPGSRPPIAGGRAHGVVLGPVERFALVAPDREPAPLLDQHLLDGVGTGHQVDRAPGEPDPDDVAVARPLR
jgi:hypothetical protein